MNVFSRLMSYDQCRALRFPCKRYNFSVRHNGGQNYENYYNNHKMGTKKIWQTTTFWKQLAFVVTIPSLSTYAFYCFLGNLQKKFQAERDEEAKRYQDQICYLNNLQKNFQAKLDEDAMTRISKR